MSDELAERPENALSTDVLKDVLGDTTGGPADLLDQLALYRQGKEDYFKLGEEKRVEVVGIFLLSARPSRAMWLSDDLTGDAPDCFSFDGVTPHEVVTKNPAATCGECPFDKLGSGQGRSKKCKTKANDFVLLLPPGFIVDEVSKKAVITAEDIVGPALINYSTANRGTSRNWQAWLRSLKELGMYPQGVAATWSFGGDRNKAGTAYSFVQIETIAPLPSAEEQPELWDAILTQVRLLKSGKKDEILLALSGSSKDEEEEAPQL